jgi:hypothetical protein
MFRSKQYCERYEPTPIQLDTTLITILANNASQQKNGYSFTLNDRSSYFDWFNGYFGVNLKINKLADGANYDSANQIVVINNVASLIDQLVIEQNGKIVYDYNNLYKVVNVSFGHIATFQLYWWRKTSGALPCIILGTNGT